MTEEQQEEFANRVADKVIKAMEKKQEEFDEEFAKSIEIQNGSYRIVSKQEYLENKLEALREELAEYLQDEEYSKAEKTSKEIDKIVKKIKDL
jgi:polyhydroxyalkanoate synthesis regulator phasin